MPFSRAVVLIDRRSAQVLKFDAILAQTETVKTHTHHTRQHSQNMRSEEDFFGEVCHELDGIAQVVVTGSDTAQSGFRHYVDWYCPSVTRQIVGWETANHPSKGQLLAFARKHFVKPATMTGLTASRREAANMIAAHTGALPQQWVPATATTFHSGSRQVG